MSSKGCRAYNRQLALQHGQRPPIADIGKLRMESFGDLAIFGADGSRRHQLDFLRKSRAEDLQRNAAEENRAHDDICVKNRPHRRDLRDLRALRTSDMAFEMSAGVIPASFARRLDSAQASSNSAASSASVGVLMGCMITAPLYARIVNDVPLCQPYIWRKVSGRTTCPFEDSLVVITFAMSNLSCDKARVLYHNSYQ